MFAGVARNAVWVENLVLAMWISFAITAREGKYAEKCEH